MPDPSQENTAWLLDQQHWLRLHRRFFFSESCSMHMRTEDEGWQKESDLEKAGFGESILVGR